MRSSFRIRAALPAALLAVLFLLAPPADAVASGQRSDDAPLPSIDEATAGTEKMDGFFPLYWDADAGRLWLEIPMLDTEVIHVSALAAGVGSNDIGLDRGQIRGTHIVRFERVGRKVLMVQPNYRYRADSDNADERRAVEEAFAKSILWGFTVAAETDGRVLVDTTDFLMQDAHNIGGSLQPANYRIDRSRSAVYKPNTKAFPQNTEMEVTLTYTTGGGQTAAAVTRPFAGGGGRGPGGGFGRGSLGAVTPTAQAVTVRQRHSIVQLPDDGFETREHDPRSGYGSVTYQDYAVPLGESMTKRFVRRHRLQKVDPTAEVSEAVEPIVYHVDRGTPEPILSALIDGAEWWNQAFEAAGYRNAFRVEVMPEGADNLDIRYNVIQWVHRSTRGWSYGGGVTDPRTGEIIKGQVSLGSLRVRQDYLIAEGLLSPYENGTETPPELAEWALARIRQLSAHEVGHTIGLGHNYYASALGRISVMDYPHPLVRLAADGSIDHSEVYDDEIGEWDKVAVAYGYQDFAPGADEAEELRAIIDEAWERDVMYLSNQDMDAHPRVHQWANGDDPAVELQRMLDVRRDGLSRFGVNAIKLGRPMATIEEVLVPLYLHHRYQVSATAAAVGGQDFIYSLRGDGHGPPVQPVSGDDQRAALAALMRAVSPAELAIPESIIGLLPPRPSGFQRHREMFPRTTGITFDTVSPAVVGAAHVFGELLTPSRAARLVQQHALDDSLPSLGEVLHEVVHASFDAAPSSPYEEEIARAVQRVATEQIMALAARASMSQARAVAHYVLSLLAENLASNGESFAGADPAHTRLLVADINRFLSRPAQPYNAPAPLAAPPGAPIGEPAMDWLTPTATSVSGPWLHALLEPEPACSWLDW